MVSPKEKPRAFSIDGLHANPSTLSASVDVSEENRETNLHDTKTHNNNVQVWNVTCVENAHKIKHICNHGKNAKCVCATNSLQRKPSTRDYTFGVLVS